MNHWLIEKPEQRVTVLKSLLMEHSPHFELSFVKPWKVVQLISIRNNDSARPSPPHRSSMAWAMGLQTRSPGPVRSVWTNWSLKAPPLLAKWTSPCPPSALGRKRTLCGTQCWGVHTCQSGAIAWRTPGC